MVGRHSTVTEQCYRQFDCRSCLKPRWPVARLLKSALMCAALPKSETFCVGRREIKAAHARVRMHSKRLRHWGFSWETTGHGPLVSPGWFCKYLATWSQAMSWVCPLWQIGHLPAADCTAESRKKTKAMKVSKVQNSFLAIGFIMKRETRNS